MGCMGSETGGLWGLVPPEPQAHRHGLFWTWLLSSCSNLGTNEIHAPLALPALEATFSYSLDSKWGPRTNSLSVSAGAC